jgi:uncharacterized membrane protein
MKSIFTSKTFWANIVGGLVLLASATGNGLPAEIASPEAQSQIVSGIMVVANIILRAITTEPVKVI